MGKLRALWSSLPHPVQAVAVLFVSAVSTYWGQALSNPAALCFSPICLKRYVAGSLLAGGVAVRAFYMLPNSGAAEQVQAASSAGQVPAKG